MGDKSIFLDGRLSVQLGRIKQSVQMYDHVLDVGLIDVPLARGSPRLEGFRVIGIDADQIEPFYIDVIRALRVGDLPPKTRCSSGLVMAGVSR